MATELSTIIGVKLETNFKDTGLDLSTPSDRLNFTFDDSLANGTASDQADIVWHDQRVLDAGGYNEELELAATAEGARLVGAFGNKIVFAKIKGIVIENLATIAGYVLMVGGSGADGFVNWVGNETDIIKIGPKGVFALWSPEDGYAVSTDDLLKIDAGANVITYKIMLVGVAA